MTNTKTEIEKLMMTATPVFCLETGEPKAALDLLAEICMTLTNKTRWLIVWDMVDGPQIYPLYRKNPDGSVTAVVDVEGGTIFTEGGGRTDYYDLGFQSSGGDATISAEMADPKRALLWVEMITEPCIYVVVGFSGAVNQVLYQTQIIKLMKKLEEQMSRRDSADGTTPPDAIPKTLILLDGEFSLPPILAQQIPVVVHNRPELSELENIVDIAISFCESAEGLWVDVKEGGSETIAQALRGLSRTEANRAMREMVLETGGVSDESDSLKALTARRIQIVNENPALTVWDTTGFSYEDVVGQDKLIKIAKEIEATLDPEAIAFGVQPQRGLMLVGPSGTGKTLSSKVIAAAMGKMLVRLDMSQVFAASGGLVGQSESQMTGVIQVIKSLGDEIVLQMDEFDRALNTQSGSTSTDGGTTDRVVSMLLTFMEEESEVALFIATANTLNIGAAAAQRLGRPILIDLGGPKNRAKAFRFFFDRSARDVENLDLDYECLAQLSVGYSYREIEEVVKLSITKAYTNDKPEVDQESVEEAITETVSTSVSRPEELWRMRLDADNGKILRGSSELCDWKPWEEGDRPDPMPVEREDMKKQLSAYFRNKGSDNA